MTNEKNIFPVELDFVEIDMLTDLLLAESVRRHGNHTDNSHYRLYDKLLNIVSYPNR